MKLTEKFDRKFEGSLRLLGYILQRLWVLNIAALHLFGFRRCASLSARLYHRLYGHEAYREVTGILGVETIDVPAGFGGPWSFSTVGRPSMIDPPYRDRRHGVRLQRIQQNHDEFGRQCEIFEMPLPHVVNELNVPRKTKRWGAAGGLGASKIGFGPRN